MIREVNSVDGALFPKEEQTILTEEQATSIEIEDGDQVLQVLRVPGEKESTDIPDIAEHTVEGFVFRKRKTKDAYENDRVCKVTIPAKR